MMGLDMLNHKMQLEALQLLNICMPVRAETLLFMAKLWPTMYPETERLLDEVREMYSQEEE